MCFNEFGSLEDTLTKVYIFLNKNSINFEIFVVEDGSTDGTKELCEKLLLKFDWLKVIFHEKNKGIGETLRSIHSNASKKWVVNVPADGQFDMNDLIGISLSEFQFVAFYRHENLVYNTKRNFLTWINKAILRYVIGINVIDVNWVKVYPAIFFHNNKVILKSSLVESEIVFKLLKANYKIVELPSKYLPREKGNSKGASFNVIKKAFNDMFKLILVTRYAK